eukprot:8711-Amphidinium_carterae.1
MELGCRRLRSCTSAARANIEGDLRNPQGGSRLLPCHNSVANSLPLFMKLHRCTTEMFGGDDSAVRATTSHSFGLAGAVAKLC